MRYQPIYYSIVAVDVVGSGSRDDQLQLRMRAELHGMLDEVLSQQSIDLGTLEQTDLGDGVRLLVPASVTPAVLLDPFIPNLDRALRQHHKTASAAARLRLRVAMHHGLVHRDELGWAGEPLVAVARLLDAAEVRRAIADTPTANLVLVVSQLVYDNVVRQGYGLDPDTYWQVPVTEKETRTVAWVHLPGHRPPPDRPVEPAVGMRHTQLIGVIPLRAGHFQHRAVADRIDRLLQPGRTAVLSQVLTGLGGVGKTQLAADCAHGLYGRGEVDLLVWVTASSREAVLSRYAEAADTVDPGRDDVVERAATRFLAWLADSGSTRWLVVIDDLPKPSVMDGLWPPSPLNGRTIVTTRRRDAALASQGRRLVDVGMFTAEEARGYLRSTLAEHSALADDLDGVAADLGYLPLALSHATAFMIDRQLPCSEYRGRFANRHRHLIELFPEPDALPDEYRGTVAATWSLSIEAANELTPRGLARPLLELASVLDPNGIPESVFTMPAARAWLATADHPHVDAADARDGLYCLHRLNLATVDAGTVRVHALVQRAVRDNLDNRLPQVMRAGSVALREAWETVPGVGWPILSSLVQVAQGSGDETLLRTTFDGLLALLDRKETDDLVDQAAAAASAIDANFTMLLPLVLECLDGVIAAPGTSSSLGPPATVTQEAASSLAATFSALDDWHEALPDRAIPVLTRALRRWRLRKRFVEALSRYGRSDALAAVLSFARAELITADDPGILGTVAGALATLGGVLSPAEQRECVAVLEQIAARTASVPGQSVPPYSGSASSPANPGMFPRSANWRSLPA